MASIDTNFTGAVLRTGGLGIMSRVGPIDLETMARRENGVSRRVHGVFASQKNRSSVDWSTSEQRDLAFLLEVDPGVLSFQSAPEQVSFIFEGKGRKHVPAFRAQTRRGPVVLDAFPAQGEGSAHRMRLLAALEEIYADRGIPYRALHAGDIRLEPRLGNAKWVKALSGQARTEEEAFRVVGALSAADRQTIAELQAELPEVSHVGSVVSNILVRRELTMDLSAPAPESIVVSLQSRMRL